MTRGLLLLTRPDCCCQGVVGILKPKEKKELCHNPRSFLVFQNVCPRTHYLLICGLCDVTIRGRFFYLRKTIFGLLVQLIGTNYEALMEIIE